MIPITSYRLDISKGHVGMTLVSFWAMLSPNEAENSGGEMSKKMAIDHAS